VALHKVSLGKCVQCCTNVTYFAIIAHTNYDKRSTYAFCNRFSAGSMSKEGPKAPLWPEGLSKVRPVGKQKPEAQAKGVSSRVAKRPELSKPGEQPAKPSQFNPVEQQAAERLGKPLPKGQEEQKEKERLQQLFASSLSKVVEDKSDERFSEKWYLRRQLSPYVDEYPFLAEDIPTLKQLRDVLNTPQASAINYAFGVFDVWDPEADQRRDRQIRQILSEAMPKWHDSPDIP
jgi:hypothetical protein